MTKEETQKAHRDLDAIKKRFESLAIHARAVGNTELAKEYVEIIERVD
jgi:hypothetical protein